MKIAILASNRKPIPSPKNLIFAPGVIIYELVEGLVRKGHEVTLFAPEGTKTNAKLITAGTRSLYEDFASEKEFIEKRAKELEKYLTMDNQYELLMASTAFEYIQQHNFDIVHSHKTIHEIYFTKLINKPTIFTLHDNPLREMSHAVDKARLLKYANDDYFISISNAQRQNLEFLNFVATVYNGVNPADYRLGKGGKNILFAGRLDKAKGVDAAIKVARATNRPMKVVGDIVRSPQGLQQYKELVTEIKKGGIDYLGHIHFTKMSKLYENAKLFLFPVNWPEAFGLVMIEAMSCGTPVVAFNCGSVPEIIKDGVTGFICSPGDLNCMAKKVKEIYEMPEEKYQAMRRACRKHVEENFTVQKMIDGYEKVYEKVVRDWRSKK